jgi:hypothetical protein
MRRVPPISWSLVVKFFDTVRCDRMGQAFGEPLARPPLLMGESNIHFNKLALRQTFDFASPHM